MSKEERIRAKHFIKELELEWDNLDDEAQNRAGQLITEDYSWSPTKKGDPKRYTTTFLSEFYKFCDEEAGDQGEGWKDCSRMFFQSDAYKEMLVIRRQKSGICCLHASVVLQHYVQSIRILRDGGKLGTNHKMLDISKFLRTALVKEKQIQYIQDGRCGLGSQEFFMMITGVQPHDLLQIKPCKKSVFPSLHPNDIETLLKLFNVDFKKEPALVSCFIIEEDFRKKAVFDYEIDPEECKAYTKSKGNPDGVLVKHAMVMLGAHKDEETGKAWFLLQNFWIGGYFRLVSGEYLASCEATISFISDVDVSLKDNLSIVDAEYAETDVNFEECAPNSPEED